MEPYILADGRWHGAHGIGRFSSEVLSRLNHCQTIQKGPKPLSPLNIPWQVYKLFQQRKNYKVFYNPGFNPTIAASIPFVFTIHDLIHLHFPGESNFIKKMYYRLFIKNSARNASKLITVSVYSKQEIAAWAGIPEENITVVANGVSDIFTAHGEKHEPGYPYLLHVGNTKPHKNVARMIDAFGIAKIDPEIKLILTGKRTKEIEDTIEKHFLYQRIVFVENLSDTELAKYYRGAQALLLPSLYEGFGLPIPEAMACGIPTLTSNVTSLPEIAGNAAFKVDPYHMESIAFGIEKICEDTTLRKNLILKGFERVKLFSWDKTAATIQSVLDEISAR